MNATQQQTRPAQWTGQTDLSESEFARLAAIAREDAGIALSESKKQMVQSRLSRHLKRAGFSDFDSYISSVEADKGGPSREELINLLTTNVSSFFRESHHFKTLADAVLPDMLTRAKKGERVRIWSAGCSTGQEPYSIAMQALTASKDLANHDFRILATDIDRDVLRTAQAATYPTREANGIPEQMRGAFTVPSKTEPDAFEIHPSVRELVSFRHLNLMATWPMKHRFDVIFCRNVVIYFDETVQAGLWPRFADALHDRGWLILGHSERLDAKMGQHFENAGITTFRKNMIVKGAA